jgi:divalent metal cation (Fe/Co/Zn/Cd) transporter
LLLTGLALLLGRETGALLTGERTNRSRLKQIREILLSDPAVERIGDLLSMQLGTDQVLINVKIKFDASLSLAQIESHIARLKRRIQQPDSSAIQIFIEPSHLDEKSHGTAQRPSTAA